MADLALTQKRRGSFHTTISCAALLLAGAQAMVCAADAYLARFAGTWIGEGALRPSADAAQEAVYCRITAELSPDGNRLQQSGRCAVGDQSRRVVGVLIYDPARGTVTGSWSGGRDGETAVAGQRSKDRLVLHLKPQLEADRPPTTMTLEPLADGRYRMLLAGGEGRGEINFRRE